MRQRLPLLVLFAFFSCAFSLTAQAQIPQITSHCFTDSCYSFHTTIVTNCTGSNYTLCKVETSHGDGIIDTQTIYYYPYFPNCSAPPTYLTGYGSEAQHNYAVTGTYTVKKVLIYGTGRVDSVSASINAACAFIGGNIYLDSNSNCVYNSGTDPLIPATMLIQVDSNGVHVDTVAAYGYWRYRPLATVTTVYSFKMITAPAGYVAACPASGIINLSYTPGFTVVAPINFGYNCSSSTAFDMQLIWKRAFRGTSSGGNSFILLTAQNNSCQPTSGTVTLQVSPKYNITTSGINPTPASVSGHTITWNIPGMVVGRSHSMYVPLVPLSTTNNGDTVCTYAIITPTTGDVNVANNSISICDSVRSSWDPNHKSVSPDGDIAAGALLTYTVQFENLGNDTAFNIHIQDTLSGNVVPSSFSLISSSHPVGTSLYEVPGGKTIVKFDFPNIQLEDKSHPLTNKGSVTFTVKAKTSLSPGTQITNRAGIYFDGNPVVLTNVAYNRIPVPSGVSTQHQASGIRVYPNPVTNAITIRVQDGWKEAILTNAIGQIVSRTALTTGNNVLAVQNLPAGIYYLQAKGSNGSFTAKVEKQ